MNGNIAENARDKILNEIGVSLDNLNTEHKNEIDISETKKKFTYEYVEEENEIYITVTIDKRREEITELYVGYAVKINQGNLINPKNWRRYKADAKSVSGIISKMRQW